MMYVKSTLLVVLGVLTLSACANLNSIARRTRLPPSGPYNGTGRAIHLDVKQRLVVANQDGHVCAEPSPDALSAYAAALSAGVSVPSQGAGSAAGAQQETAASIHGFLIEILGSFIFQLTVPSTPVAVIEWRSYK